MNTLVYNNYTDLTNYFENIDVRTRGAIESRIQCQLNAIFGMYASCLVKIKYYVLTLKFYIVST